MQSKTSLTQLSNIYKYNNKNIIKKNNNYYNNTLKPTDTYSTNGLTGK